MMESTDNNTGSKKSTDTRRIGERLAEIRGLNNQENELINNRFTWMGVIEGLLITAYVAVLDGFFDAQSQRGFYLWILLGLSILGTSISVSFNKTFKMARQSLKKLKDRYFELIEHLDVSSDIEYPITIALFCDCKDKESIRKNKEMKESKFDPWFITPKAFIFVWVMSFILDIYSF